MKTLTAIQEESVSRLLQERSGPSRYEAWRKAVHRWHWRELTALGYSPDQCCDSWKDVTDMVVLHRIANRAAA